MAKPQPDKFTEQETRKRFEAALRGARIAGHKPMSEIASKRKTDMAARKRTKAKKSNAR